MPARLPLLALALAALVAVPASACSVVSSYRVATNLELVERAEAIVLGTVERQQGEGSPFDTEVVVRPTLLLKGAAVPDEIRLRGYLAKGGGNNATRSDPRELYRVNPDALTGGCNRYVFERGMQLVVFLQRDGKGLLRPSLPPFARAAEDVPGPDSLWVKAVRQYVDIVALPADRRPSALIARRDALRAAGGPDDIALADDIDRNLKKKRLPNFD
ncbi:MAG TPA: hypothetical protein VFP12_00310 [Allosphingosinicella sp.]|nr:hypothetical protein [Allosphingosinicella sp.]